MCAVCWPLFAENGDVILDGKIGIFPFTTMEPAKRKSKNRQKGTLETKPIQSVNKAVMRECLIQKVNCFYFLYFIYHTLTHHICVDYTSNQSQMTKECKQGYIHSTRQCQASYKPQ